MILQAAANAKRTCFRVNITRQTDESDLIGGFRLVNGDTVWVDGAAFSLLKRVHPALGRNRPRRSCLMCLQPLAGRQRDLRQEDWRMGHSQGWLHRGRHCQHQR